MRRLLALCSLVALIAASAVFLVTAQAADAPEMVTLGSCGDKQPAVNFPHSKHVGAVECKVCHHTQPDLTADSTVAVETCVSCHKDPEDPKTPDCAQMSPTKNPYHITCMGCHKDSVKKDAALKGKVPVTCKECHVK